MDLGCGKTAGFERLLSRYVRAHGRGVRTPSMRVAVDARGGAAGDASRGRHHGDCCGEAGRDAVRARPVERARSCRRGAKLWRIAG
ncbi:hypothetical protein PT2222_80101 [Paraburkholderia tropica]